MAKILVLYQTDDATRPHWINSLTPRRFGCDFKNLIFNLVSLIGILRSLYDNALRWMPQNIIDDKSTLVQVMAWCRQATSHYLSQCWLRSMSPYDVIRPQWVNKLVDILQTAFASTFTSHTDNDPDLLHICITRPQRVNIVWYYADNVICSYPLYY